MVDGKWCLNPNYPTEFDENGNENNFVYGVIKSQSKIDGDDNKNKENISEVNIINTSYIEQNTNFQNSEKSNLMYEKNLKKKKQNHNQFLSENVDEINLKDVEGLLDNDEKKSKFNESNDQALLNDFFFFNEFLFDQKVVNDVLKTIKREQSSDFLLTVNDKLSFDKQIDVKSCDVNQILTNPKNKKKNTDFNIKSKLSFEDQKNEFSLQNDNETVTDENKKRNNQENTINKSFDENKIYEIEMNNLNNDDHKNDLKNNEPLNYKKTDNQFNKLKKNLFNNSIEDDKHHVDDIKKKKGITDKKNNQKQSSLVKNNFICVKKRSNRSLNNLTLVNLPFLLPNNFFLKNTNKMSRVPSKKSDAMLLRNKIILNSLSNYSSLNYNIKNNKTPRTILSYKFSSSKSGSKKKNFLQKKLNKASKNDFVFFQNENRNTKLSNGNSLKLKKTKLFNVSTKLKKGKHPKSKLIIGLKKVLKSWT